MKTEIKNAIRRAAIKAGQKTANWSDIQFQEWAEQNQPSLLTGDTRKLPQSLLADVWNARKELGLQNKGVTHVELAQWVADESTNCPSNVFADHVEACRSYLDAKGESYAYLRNGKADSEPETVEPVATGDTPDTAQALALLQTLLNGNKGISEDRVKELIAEFSTTRRVIDVNVYSDDVQLAKIEGAHYQYPKLLTMLSAGVNVCAVGPAGSGKSTMFKHAAKSLGLDYYYQGSIQTESKVLGFMSATGSYIGTPFRTAYQNGGIFVLEEYDACHPKALAALNNAISSDAADFPDGMVEKHPQFVCCLAGNTYGTGANAEYVGRAKLDEASLDRFSFITIGYDEALEREIALSINPDAGSWVSEVQTLRAKVMDANIKTVISPRASIDGAKMLKAGLGLNDVRESRLYCRLSTDQRAQLGV